jgi:cyanophycinase
MAGRSGAILGRRSLAMNITPVSHTKAGAGLASRLGFSLAALLALALCCLTGILLSCARSAGIPAEGLWLEGELTAAGSPVRFEIEGLVSGTPYRIALYDRFRPSERGESASTKTVLTRPDWRSAEGYEGTHDGFYYSDDPGDIVVRAADSAVRISLETSKESGKGSFRVHIKAVDEAEYERRRRVESQSDGIVPTITSGTHGSAQALAALPRYGLFLHGSSIVPAARDLHGSYASGGDQVFLSAEAGRFVELPGVASTTSFVVNSPRRAAAPSVSERVSSSAALLFDGGDQSRYVRSWADTPLLDALNQAAARGVPVGGNSAGLAIMGQYAYAALHDHDLVAGEALADPYNEWMTLEEGFLSLPGLEGVITETHYSERGREGRLVAFLARLLQDKRAALGSLYGVGVDENSCLAIDDEGRALVYGPGSAWILVPQSMPGICAPGKPLGWSGKAVKAIRLAGGLDGADHGLWQDIRKLPADAFFAVEAGKLRRVEP